MAKWYGSIGFVETVETEPGIWEPTETIRQYYGDIISNTRRWSEKQDSTNDDISINNRISVVADSYIQNHLHILKWIEYGGCKWKVSDITINFPRIEFGFGGVYNGETS